MGAGLPKGIKTPPQSGSGKKDANRIRLAGTFADSQALATILANRKSKEKEKATKSQIASQLFGTTSSFFL